MSYLYEYTIQTNDSISNVHKQRIRWLIADRYPLRLSGFVLFVSEYFVISLRPFRCCCCFYGLLSIWHLFRIDNWVCFHYIVHTETKITINKCQQRIEQSSRKLLLWCAFVVHCWNAFYLNICVTYWITLSVRVSVCEVRECALLMKWTRTATKAECVRQTRIIEGKNRHNWSRKKKENTLSV